MKTNLLIVAEEDSGKRIDVYVNEKLDVSRSFIKNLIEDSNILLNDKPLKKAGIVVKTNDKVSVVIPSPELLDLTPENLDIDIVYQDKDLAVINKPQGMVVHPAPGSYDKTLVNALLYHLDSLSSINGIIRPGIVHRLDKNTSGLLVVAKNDKAHISLQEQIQTKSAKRYYIALVDGVVQKDEGIITTLIDRSTKDRKMMAVSKTKGRDATTLYKVLKRYPNYTLMEYELKTGRTHQIRVHSKHIGHPVVGDDVYGGSNKFGLNGQLLHAFKLTITQPTTGEHLEFTAPIPEYFQNVLDKLDHKN